jgi:diaminopimelate decarboxylase
MADRSVLADRHVLDEALSIHQGHLWMEGCDTVDLANRFGTPLYVASEDQLRRNLRRIRSVLEQAWGGPVQVLPSIKANFNLAVRRILNAEGTGCDCFGPSELHAALTTGVSPHLISVNGSSKDAGLIETAVAAGARITLDSPREYDLVVEAARRLGKRATIRLRLRPDYRGLDQPSDFFPDLSIRTAADRYKPGIPFREATAVGRQALAAPEVDLTGLMVHLGRHSARSDVWASMARSFADLVADLCQAWGVWRPRELDIGGGFPSPRDPTNPGREPAPPLDETAGRATSSLRQRLRERGIDPAGMILEAEPGRGLFADTGIHLTRVRNIKDQITPNPWRWVETDTTEMFLADLLVEHAHFRPIIASRAQEPAAMTADIVGISCGFDVLASQVELPLLSPGDVIAFLDTGAYQDAVAANFNALPRPGTVLVSGSNARWIKRPETIADVFARDVVPE